MIKSEKVENRRTAQGLVLVFVIDSNNKIPSNIPKSNVESSNLMAHNSSRLPDD